MGDDRRVTFIRKWLRRAQEEEDEFDKFFAGWIALVVAAQRMRSQEGRRREDDTDRLRILDYFTFNRKLVLTEAANHKDQLRALAQRRGSRRQNPIVDTRNPELGGLFKELAAYYESGEPMEEDVRVRALAELLNKVRNNVFHGIKVYDDTEDMRLLELLNPFMLAVLSQAECV